MKKAKKHKRQMVSQNKIFSFKIKREMKNVFPGDDERTVDQPAHKCSLIRASQLAFYVNLYRAVIGPSG